MFSSRTFRSIVRQYGKRYIKNAYSAPISTWNQPNTKYSSLFIRSSLNYKHPIRFFTSKENDNDNDDDNDDEEEEESPFSVEDEYEVFDDVHYPDLKAKIGEVAPHFTAPAVIDGEIGSFKLTEYRGKYVVLLFYPKDFTFVCPTELIAFSDRAKEFEKINAKVVAISTDTENSHLAWTRLARNLGGLGRMQIPLVADTKKVISNSYGVLSEKAGIAFRGLFIINPEGILEQITINNFPVGRSVDETLRLLQAFQFVAEHGEVCPANWQPGDKTIIPDPEDSQKYFSGVTNEVVNNGKNNIFEIESVKEFEKIISTEKIVVADFMASWCGKCSQILPFVEDLANKHDHIKFIKIDTASKEFDILKEKYNITSLPAFISFKNGKETGTPITGYKKRLLAEEIEKL